MKSPEPQIIIYKTDDGQTKLRVKIEDESVWLTQDQMAELFDKSKSTINEHIQNIYGESELSEAEGQTMRKFGNSEFSTKPTNYYNLGNYFSRIQGKITTRNAVPHLGDREVAGVHYQRVCS